MDEFHRNRAAECGYGEVAEVLHTATVLHEGWELDNRPYPPITCGDGSVVVSDGNEVRVYEPGGN